MLNVLFEDWPHRHPAWQVPKFQTSRRKAVCSNRHIEPFISYWLASSQNPSSPMPAKGQSCKQDFQKIAVRCTILTFFCTYDKYFFICLLAFCIPFPVKGKLKNYFFKKFGCLSFYYSRYKTYAKLSVVSTSSYSEVFGNPLTH